MWHFFCLEGFSDKVIVEKKKLFILLYNTMMKFSNKYLHCILIFLLTCLWMILVRARESSWHAMRAFLKGRGETESIESIKFLNQNPCIPMPKWSAWILFQVAQLRILTARTRFLAEKVTILILKPSQPSLSPQISN